ncbi:MAG: NAD(P)(+) transhydrogenase (Re/Si-specific) subunit beta [Planctomycetes bacterium]|nr:NAD(P)(+) transhydrogenase (Re/Si-specific) subunit beta [Planctomycetota bacterium]
MHEYTIQFFYAVAAVCFILALKWLSAVPTARRGVITGILGMLLAVVGTLLKPELLERGFGAYQWILVAFVVGTVIGVPMALMPMTAVPQRTALSHAFGALAAALVGAAHFFLESPNLSKFTMGALGLEVLLGFLTFTASLMAFGKLQELLPQRPIVFKFQNIVNLSILSAAVLIAIFLIFDPGHKVLFLVMSALALTFGVLLIIPIGGADMPTVISLLNSYAGLAAAAMGFVLDNKLLIIAGSLDGSSGLILSIIMCKAMNRSFTNVLFGGFGQLQVATGQVEKRNVRSASPEEAAELLATATSVMVIPGYGMAVAQAQHKVRELFDQLTKRGITVRFAIHPVAGRMPGHMNVLLAEADIPYDKLMEMDDANPEMPQVDVALVIGANDVTNPAARHDKNSPIYGMPIIDTDKARTVMVIKRSMNPGFAGIENELYFMPQALMLFGDAKSFVGEIVKSLASPS